MFENSVYPGHRRPAASTPQRRTPIGGRDVEAADLRPRRSSNISGWRSTFEAVCGPELDGVGAVKTRVVADAMTALDVAASTDVVLVGDRSHDVIGAHANGIACIGVLWGYGSRDELAAADAIAADVDELADLLGVAAA